MPIATTSQAAEGRRSLAHEPDFALGGMLARPSLSEVEVHGERQHVEPRVMQVLVALAHAHGEVRSRDDLIFCCWDGTIVGDDAINRVIGKIRHIALQEGAGFKVETLPRIGYRLILHNEAPPIVTGRIPRARAKLAWRRFMRRWAYLVPVFMTTAAAVTVMIRFGCGSRSMSDRLLRDS